MNKKQYILTKAAGFFMACAALVACSTNEIKDGTSDIDNWPIEPKEQVVYPEKFIHPGVAFNMQDVERWRQIVKTQAQPQYAGFEKFRDDKYSQSNYVMNGPYKEIYSNEDDTHPNITNQVNADWAAACQNAIMYAATGQKAFADKSVEIIRAYANTTKGEFWSGRPGGSDHILIIGNLVVKYVYAVELMRYLPDTGLTENDFQAACTFLKESCVTVLDKFFARTDPKTKAVGNFGASAMNSYMCMGILMDNMEMYKKAVMIYLDQHPTCYESGSIARYIDGETGQCQESGRDQTHAQLGLGMMSMLCEVAWKQGTDLYGVLNNRLLSGYEYTAKYNLGYDVPFHYMPELTGKYNWYEIDQQDKEQYNSGQRDNLRRGLISPVYERCYNHYVNRKGLQMQYVKEILDNPKWRPEGDGSPDVAHLGFGTFLYCGEGFADQNNIRK